MSCFRYFLSVINFPNGSKDKSLRDNEYMSYFYQGYIKVLIFHEVIPTDEVFELFFRKM